MNINIGDRYNVPSLGCHVTVTDIIEDEDWRHTFIELEDVNTGYKQLKNVTNIHSKHYLNPTTMISL